ncbi:hypothetical protein M441DRAFT_28223 [Trichoderma asperellum CBS 433.97]|uniref:Uncharacterized protein n=1 Tax=Trichoderma asperellum (strain ATCC 204424 / CBS 433.97 / NBRC 101777) TaxID=1042311 RepID=A0A2T3Z6G4_TRIA4|nr:hypothetical protein M441DRAFT_28223 [Trichoderma asperellum CBS 433.97]PTB40399.1 hypothetical protein M441DRAFT_28223 [Trichoderma asperellum CBS 433.97]
MFTGNHQRLRRGGGYGLQTQQINQNGRTQENPNRNAQQPSADRFSDLAAQVAQFLSQSGGADRSGNFSAPQVAQFLSQSGGADRSGNFSAPQVAQFLSQSGGTDRSSGLATQQIAHITDQSGGAGRSGDPTTPQAARLVNNDHGLNDINSMQPTEHDLVVQLGARVERLETDTKADSPRTIGYYSI